LPVVPPARAANTQEPLRRATRSHRPTATTFRRTARRWSPMPCSTSRRTCSR
jgi:hypothetical protein